MKAWPNPRYETDSVQNKTQHHKSDRAGGSEA